MAKTMRRPKEVSERAKKWKSVRFCISKDVDVKFYKKVQGEVMRDLYHFCVKCVEQQARGCSPASVAEKEGFREFREVSERLKWKALPEDYESFSPEKKIGTAKSLVDEIYNKLAPAVSVRADQAVDSQADSSDILQVGSGSGSARQLDMTDKEDVDMQVNDPDQTQVEEVPAPAPNPELDNPEGRSPSRPPVPLELLVSIFNDLMLRAARFPGVLPKLEWSEAALRSFVIQLESLEGALEDRSGTLLRSRQEEYFAPVADFTADESLTRLASMDEDFLNEFWGNVDISPGRLEAPGTSPNLYAR